MKQLFCVGTYTEAILFGTGELFQGKGKGISICSFDDGEITEISNVPVRNPSFLCVDRNSKKLYCVNEMKEYLGETGGGISEFDIYNNYQLTFAQTMNSCGTDPCHIVLSPDRNFLVISNFASGTVTVVFLSPDGKMTNNKRVFQHQGFSVHPLRQKGPHAHSAIFAPDGVHFFIPDLGIDQLVAYKYDGSDVYPDPDYNVLISAGSGPRYGEFNVEGSHFYLINEISSQIVHFRYEEGSLIQMETSSTLPDEYTGENICSDLHITSDSKYLFASNRGHDSIAVFSLDQDGVMTRIRIVPCGGKTPRNFCIDPSEKYLLIGNQDSDNITVMSTQEGNLKVVKTYYWGSPVCIQFIK